MSADIPIVKYKLSEVQNQCVNYDHNIHTDLSDLIVYEESYKGMNKRYCFSVKNDIVNLLKSNLNPITGRLFSLDFITLIRERYGTATIGKLITPSDFNEEDCIECDTDTCKTDVVLSKDTINWLQFYISKTYMVDLKHHVIPYNIRKDLLKIKKCDDYSNKLFRGVSFSLVNIPYYINYLNIGEEKEFKEEYIKPISTSIEADVAEEFSLKRTFGIVIEFVKIKKSDILVDLNLLDLTKNKFDETTQNNINDEQEVILLPGVYKQKIIGVVDSLDLTVEQLTRLYNIFKDEIVYDKDNKVYTFRGFEILNYSDIIFQSDECNVVISLDEIEQTFHYEPYKKFVKNFDTFDEILDYLEDQLEFLFMPIYVPKKIRNMSNISERHSYIIKYRTEYYSIAKNKQLQVKSLKMLYDYIIRNNVLKVNPKLIEKVKNNLTVLEKENVPGPYNPATWVPLVKNKLFTL